MPVLDALHDAPDYAIGPAAHLLAALAPHYPRGCVFLCVVDPGVGGKREPIVIEADGRTYLGPDNGLLSVLWQRARRRKCFRIEWRPKRLTSSFHGRDLFAPVAAALALGRVPPDWLAAKSSPDILLDGGDLARVIRIDHYGNCATGLRAKNVPRNSRIRAGKRFLHYARIFEVAKGPFWHRNSMGLVEIAAPRTSAARLLRLRVGSAVRLYRTRIAR